VFKEGLFSLESGKEFSAKGLEEGDVKVTRAAEGFKAQGREPPMRPAVPLFDKVSAL